MNFPNAKGILLISIIILVASTADPVLANKFETIGSGVSGEFKIKVEYLRIFAYVVSGLFLVSGLLSVITKKKNSHDLNYTVWKYSALMFFVLSILAFVIARIV